LIALFVANAFLAVAWLLVTLGLRRQESQDLLNELRRSP
jgi:hypothetical protein